MTRHQVVILGGGFAGLTCARRLCASEVEITVVDRTNHHLFQPLLYQVATAGLSAPDIASPLRKIVRGCPRTTVLLAEVRGVDLARRAVLLDPGELPYDALVVATGAVTSYFGHPEWERHAPGLKDLADAFEIRRRVLLAFESAERAPDDASRLPFLSFVIVGGGATGVELAGALSDIARRTLARDFRRFDPASARIVLLDAGDRLLPSFPAELSEAARLDLERLGVEVRLGTRVVDLDERGVEIETQAVRHERIEARTLLWAAGVRASPLVGGLGAPVDRQGRVRVEEDLSLPGHHEVFVVGDAAAVEGVPGLAPAAIQMGRHAADSVLCRARGQPTRAFRYRDRGQLATVGRASAVAELGGRRWKGLLAWLLWAGVHVFFLIGFRNRLLVMFEWAWSYLTFQRGARVVPEDKPPAR